MSAGIVLADVSPVSATVWCVLSLFLLTFFGVVRHHYFSRTLSDLFLFLSLICSGGASLRSMYESDARAVVQPVSQEQRVWVDGSLRSPASPTRSGYSFDLDVEQFRAEPRATSTVSAVRVYARTDVTEARPRCGERVRVTGYLDRFPSRRNPGTTDFGTALRLNGIDAVISARGLVHLAGDAPGGAAATIGRIQETMYSWIDSLHAGDQASFLKGVVLGYRADLPDELKQAFADTGTIHILAVSGSNVALVALVAVVFSGMIRIPKRIAIVVAIGSIIAYMLITGGGPSITRATVMGTVVILSSTVQRRTDIFQSLGVAATFLLATEPRSLYDLGFLLSFSSVIAIVAGGTVVERWIALLPEEFRESTILRNGLLLCGMTLMAQLGTLPISAASFGRISIISIIANLFVVPLSGVILLLGVTELSLFSLAPSIARLYAEANGFLIDLLLRIVKTASTIPFASVELRIDGFVMAVLLYAVIVLLLWFSVKEIRRVALMASLISLAVLTWDWALAPVPHTLDVMTIDVGQGDAHLLTTPSGTHILVDTGPGEGEAERAIIPVLQASNVSHLDAVLISHPHLDHTGGLALLLDRISVSTLITSDSVSLGARVDSLVAAKGVHMLRVKAGMQVSTDPSARIYVLGPTEVRKGRGWNNNSVAVRCLFGSTSLVACGDAEEEAEEEMVDRWGGFLVSDVLKLGHHGSNTSTSDRFRSAVTPRIGLVSAGFRNKFHHPSGQRIRELESSGAQIYETMWLGALWLRSDGRTWQRVQWDKN